MKPKTSLYAASVFLFFSLGCSLIPFLSAPSEKTPATKTPALPTATALPKDAPAFDDWPIYTNEQYGFRLNFPPGGEIQEQFDVYARIGLPFVEGTTLADKYLEANVYQGIDPCASQEFSADSSKTENLQISGLDWLKEGGGDSGAGTAKGWTAYSTARGNVCVSLSFYLVVTNASKYDPTPPSYDSITEMSVFADIVSTFEWLKP